MPILDFFWMMLIFFLWVIWIWLLITVFIDIFRDHSLNGWLKAAWILFIIVLPLLGVLIYLIVNGDGMHKRQTAVAVEQQEATTAYIQQAAGSTTADQLTQLAALHDSGQLSDDEFAAQKAKVLAS